VADEYRAAIKRALPDGEKALGANKLTESHLDAYREMNVAIRETIFAARNRMLADAVRLTLNMPGASIRRIVTFYYDDVCRRHEGHHPIYELIVVGQGRRAEMMMREHVIGLAQSGGWSGPSPSRFSGASAIIPWRAVVSDRRNYAIDACGRIVEQRRALHRAHARRHSFERIPQHDV